MNDIKDQAIYARIEEIVSRFNKKDLALAPDTRFADDLELDSLTVMDLVAEIEDEFDVTLPLNMLPDLENIRDVANAVAQLSAKG